MLGDLDLFLECIPIRFFHTIQYRTLIFDSSNSLKFRKKAMPRWQRSDEDEEDDDDGCDSPTTEQGRRMLPPTISYKSPSQESSPTAASKSPAANEYVDIHRQILSLRRGSRASRASSGMIEMVEDALGGAVVNVLPAPNGAGGGGTAGMDARYRKWQTRAYNFLERPRGKAIAYHVVV